MKQMYSLYECNDRATRMIPHSQFPILVLPTDVRVRIKNERFLGGIEFATQAKGDSCNSSI